MEENNITNVRVGITCLPIYIWATTEEGNGTTFHGVSIALLRNMLNNLNINLEYVQHDYDPTINVVLQGKTYMFVYTKYIRYTSNFINPNRVKE